MPRTKSITLGGQTYEIAQLPMRENRLWREKVTAPVSGLHALLDGNRDLEIATVGDLAHIIDLAKSLLLDSMDVLLDALFAYSPVLQADRARIEAEAYDDEALTALAEVVRLAYPLERVMGAAGGWNATATSTNLPLPNGASGTKQHSARQAAI